MSKNGIKTTGGHCMEEWVSNTWQPRKNNCAKIMPVFDRLVETGRKLVVSEAGFQRYAR